jgi:hypothetical protein
LLCIFKIIKKLISWYNSHQMEYDYDDYENYITSSKNRDQMPLETRTIYNHPFSFPLDWSLDSAFICISGLRHLAVVPKMIRTGINPMYMADPSKSGQPTTDTEEVPNWLSEFRQKKAETMRKLRAKTVKEKKSAVPGWMRSRQCRERKAATTQVKSSTVTQVTNDESRYTRNDTSLIWLYPALICSVLILTLFILFRSNLTAAILRRETLNPLLH